MPLSLDRPAALAAPTAKLFAAEGAKVVVVGTNAELGENCVAEIKTDGGEAVFCKTDVTSEESLSALVKVALDTYGRIDILVNNAGVGGSTANMNDITMVNGIKSWRPISPHPSCCARR